MILIGQERFAHINENLNRRLAEKKALVAVHRGAWGGNIIENTIPSYAIALEMGADMFECDLSRSTNGELYVFHDGGEPRLLGLNRNIQTMSSFKIDKLTYRNSLGMKESSVHVERFENVLRYFTGDVLYNLDRAWTILPDAAAMLEKYPHVLKQIIIKTPVKREYLEFLDSCPQKYMYMPIAYSLDEVHEVLSYKNINLVGIELIAVSRESELFQDSAIQFIKKQGLFVWVNAITLSAAEEQVLYGRLDDDTALLEGYDKAWGALFEKGADVLQTDWPYQLSRYRDSYFGLDEH